MMDFETIKQVFDGSFDNGSYVKITENQFDEFYRAHEMCWDNWSDAPESLCARWFETHYMNIQKDNNICFAIKYSACLSYIQNEEQIKDISNLIKDFVSQQRYKNVKFYTFCEERSSCFVAIFFGCAQIV